MPPPENLVLLVEDSDDDAVLFKRAMERSGLRNPVHVVASVDDALSYLEGSGRFADRSQFPVPKIVFVDLRIPNRDGFELLQWLGDKREFRNLHVVAVSGINRLQDVTRAYQLGANSFVTKPIKAEDLQNLARGFAAYWQ